jgi:peptide/nickel transport system substrate-binding protein
MDYDPTKDICYGDYAQVKGGMTDMLWCSGPYQLISADDYGIEYQKNPGYMPEDERFAPSIANIYMKFIKDTSSATSAFRAGEVDILGSVAATDVEVVEADAKNTVLKRSSNGVTYAVYNLQEGSKMRDVNLRKAVMYAIDQNDFIAYNNGYVMPVYSTVGTLVNTGNLLTKDLVAANKYLATYQGLAE